MSSPLRVNTVELLRRPGTTRAVDETLPWSTFDSPDPRIDADAPVHVALTLDALNDGVAVSGTVSFPWHGTCRRCAVDVSGVIDAEVGERYQETVTDPDAFEFDGLQLDLEPLAREVVLLEVPDTPLCRPDCAGLCLVCGADRNADPCSCEAPAADPRWGALDQLKTLIADPHEHDASAAASADVAPRGGRSAVDG